MIELENMEPGEQLVKRKVKECISALQQKTREVVEQVPSRTQG